MFEVFLNKLDNIVKLVDEKIDIILAKDDSLIVEAMRYATLSPGKRIRPFLTITCANIFNVNLSSSLIVGSAIELIHAYSLVHDDLPSMDNDEFRRGQPSCHIKYGEGEAILVGDALLTKAFAIIADDDNLLDPQIKCTLITKISKAIGELGMIGGQMLDIMHQKGKMKLSEKFTIDMKEMKTAALFAISCEAGAIIGKASEKSQLAIANYGRSIGLAFQITDDLLDNEFLEKNNKKDNEKYVRDLIDQAINCLSIFGDEANSLRELACYIVKRKI